MDTSKSKTTDGVAIVPGLRVWTTNIEVVSIVKPLFEERGVIWWAVDNGGMFDGGRLATVWSGKRADA